MGFVQAVTGTGKTRVGMEAIRENVDEGGVVLVLVPTVALLEQWLDALRREFGSARVGARGGTARDTFGHKRVIVSTPQSARTGTGYTGGVGLLVADEVHRYGSRTWSEALDPRFSRRLGLTATYDRPDDGAALYLDPYFNGPDPVFSINYERAIADGVVAPFRLAFVGVALSDEEFEEYETWTEQCRAARRTLSKEGVPEEPFGVFMLETQKAADGAYGKKAKGAAWRYLAAFSGRRKLLADNDAKLARLAAFDPIVSQARATLVFTQTMQAARSAAEQLAVFGHKAAAITSDSDAAERRDALEAFKAGSYSVLAAPRILDEGIDVPDADLGIIVASSSSRRQMIQRMGRVLRLKPDGAHARLIVLFAEGTSEDPAKGAHADFIGEVEAVAEAQRTFSHRESAEEIARFLG